MKRLLFLTLITLGLLPNSSIADDFCPACPETEEPYAQPQPNGTTSQESSQPTTVAAPELLTPDIEVPEDLETKTQEEEALVFEQTPEMIPQGGNPIVEIPPQVPVDAPIEIIENE